MLPEMVNPWKGINDLRTSYVLDQDRARIQTDQLAERETIRVVEGSIPEPFIGSPQTATVVLLGLNPGHSDDDQTHYQENKAFRDAIFKNLRHEAQDYPFYPLNPAFKHTPVAKWWLKRTRALRELAGVDDRTVAQRLMVIEWFPYHSTNYNETRHKCESQSYSHGLARALRKCGRIVVGLRAKRLWDTRLDGVQYLKNPQCSYVSPGNMDTNLFDEVIGALRGG
jgi:hypothetical protein